MLFIFIVIFFLKIEFNCFIFLLIFILSLIIIVYYNYKINVIKIIKKKYFVFM